MKSVFNHVYEIIQERMVYIIVAVVVVLPILFYSMNSVPGADDFSGAVAVREIQKESASMLVASLIRTRDIYLLDCGFFFSSFLNSFFSPLLRAGIEGVRWFNTISILFFFVSLYCLAQTVAKYVLCQSNKVGWLLFDLFAIILTNSNVYNNEIYTWYTVQSIYVMPVSIMFIMWALLIFESANEKMSIGYLVACLLAFVLGGTSLNIVVLNICFIMIYTYSMIVGRSKKRYGLFVLLFLIGAMVNVAAPGNYIKLSAFSKKDYSILSAIKDSIRISENLIENKMIKTPLLVAVLLLFSILLVYYSSSAFKLNYKHPFLVAVLCFSGIVAVNFTVIFGYSEDRIEAHCVFVNDIATYFLGFVLLLYIVGWIKIRYAGIVFSKHDIRNVIILYVLVSVLYMNTNGISFFSTFYMMESIQSGRLKANALYYEDVLREIEDSKEVDCVLKRPEIVKDELYYPIGLTDDKDYWINESIARYYGKNSVILIPGT